MAIVDQVAGREPDDRNDLAHVPGLDLCVHSSYPTYHTRSVPQRIPPNRSPRHKKEVTTRSRLLIADSQELPSAQPRSLLEPAKLTTFEPKGACVFRRLLCLSEPSCDSFNVTEKLGFIPIILSVFEVGKCVGCACNICPRFPRLMPRPAGRGRRFSQPRGSNPVR